MSSVSSSAYIRIFNEFYVLLVATSYQLPIQWASRYMFVCVCFLFAFDFSFFLRRMQCCSFHFLACSWFCPRMMPGRCSQKNTKHFISKEMQSFYSTFFCSLFSYSSRSLFLAVVLVRSAHRCNVTIQLLKMFILNLNLSGSGAIQRMIPKPQGIIFLTQIICMGKFK